MIILPKQKTTLKSPGEFTAKITSISVEKTGLKITLQSLESELISYTNHTRRTK